MHGENLFNAALIIDKAGQEIDAMLEKLFSVVKKKLELKDFIQKVEFSNQVFDEDDGWVYKGTLVNYSIFKKGAKKANAYLAVQVKLCDEKEQEIVGTEPLVYVLFSSGEKWEYDEFLLYNAVADGWKLNDKCLWEFFDEDEDRSSERPWDQAEWAFVVPLVSLNTPDDLKESIVNPVKALIEGEPTKEAFAHSKKVLKYLVGDDNSTISVQGN